MAKKVTANGKTFTFDDNVSNDQIGSVVDEYFSSLKKKVDTNVGENTSQNGQPILPSGGITDLNSLASGSKQSIPAPLTPQGQTAYNQEQVFAPQQPQVNVPNGKIDFDKVINSFKESNKKASQLYYEDPTLATKREQAKNKIQNESEQAIIDKQNSDWEAEHGKGLLSKAGLIATSKVAGLTKGLTDISNGINYYTSKVGLDEPTIGLYKKIFDSIGDKEHSAEAQALLENPNRNQEARELLNKSANLGLNPDYTGANSVDKAVNGFLRFVPQIVASESTGGASFFLGAVGTASAEVDKLKKEGHVFKNGSDEFYIGGVGLASMLLMKGLPVSNLISKTPVAMRDGLAKEISLNALKSIANSGESITAEGFTQAVKDEATSVSNTILKRGVNALKDLPKNYLHTAKTLSELTVADEALKHASNKLGGEDNLQTSPEQMFDNIKHILTVDAPLFSIPGLATGLFRGSEARNEVLNSLKEDSSPQNVEQIKSDIQRYGAEKGWSDSETHNSINSVDHIAEAVKSIPKDFSNKKFNTAVELITGRNNLKDQLSQIKESKQSLDESIRDIPTKEEELVQAKLEQSNDKLQELATGDKYKYSEDAEKGTYTKQLGNGKPQEISKDRYELEQIEKQFKNQSNKKTNEQNVNEVNVNEENVGKEKNVVLPTKPTEQEITTPTVSGDGSVGVGGDVESTTKALEDISKNKPTIWQSVKDAFNKGVNKVFGGSLKMKDSEKLSPDKIKARVELIAKKLGATIEYKPHPLGAAFNIANDGKFYITINPKLFDKGLGNQEAFNTINVIAHELGHAIDAKEVLKNNLSDTEISELAKLHRAFINTFNFDVGEDISGLETAIKNNNKNITGDEKATKISDLRNPETNAHRHEQEELFADALRMMVISPELAKRLAPNLFERLSKHGLGDNEYQSIAEAYHDAKSKGIENDFTKAVEQSLPTQEVKTNEQGTTEQQQGQQENRQYKEEPIPSPKAEAGSSDSTIKGRQVEEVKPNISSEKPTDVSKEVGSIVGDITDKEYNNFIDNGKVEPERLNDIANKVKNRENLTVKENEIFSDKTSDINKIIANEQGTTIKETKVEAQPIEKPTKGEKVGNAEDTKVVEPVSKLQTAKEKLAEKKKALKDLDINLGISADPKQKAKALYEYHSALVDVAKEYIKETVNEGIKTVEDFAKELGEKVSKTIKDAWDEANGGNKLKEDDFLEQPKDKSNEISVEEKIGLTKKDVQQLRNELGEEQYQYEVKKRSKLEQQAQKMLDDGYDLKGLVERVKNGEIPKSDVEVELIRRYYGNLTDALNKNPTAELLKEKNDFLRATDLAKTETGRLVQAWDGFTDVKDDLADFLTEESKYADLSQKEITELTDKYKKAEEARAKLQEQVDRLTAEANNKRAIEEFAKIKRKQARTNTRGEVKQAEKDYRKSKIDNFRNELRKIRNQTNAIIFPYQRELIAVAPLVRDLTASYAREGINDLKIVLRGIKEELKNDIPELTEDDVRDILAGQYPNPKNTKNSKLAEIVDLQRQAKLELEIDNLQKGILKEKSPVERKKKSDKVSELEREVKLLKQQHPELTYPEKLEDRKRFYKNQIEKIKDEIKRGEYDPLVEPQKIVLDQEALKLKDEWQNFKEETRERREKREDESRSKTDKAIDLLSQTADLLRLAQTSIDLSIPFRQGIRIMFNFNRETSAIGGRAYAEMVKSVFNTEAKGLKKLEFSEKNYHRMMFDLENNPKYLEAKDDGIIFTEIGSNNNEFRDENHRANFLYKIPYLSAPFKASERAAAAWTNYARFELYLKGTRALEAQGKTRINSKEAYESMAARVLTDTGRGKIPLLPEQSRSEGERNVKKVLGAVLYGPRLVSSVIRRLNPLYYFNPKVDITVRKEAAKDLVGYISAQVVLGLVANQLGYNVNMNPDDSDFLKWRKGKEVIDVTGGESTAARTAFRIVNAVIKQADPTVNKDDANKYSAFMQASVSNFWRNKLSPTYSYGMNFVTGKNSIGEAFNPYDILKVYPMYTDDIVKAVKEDRIMQLGYVIPIGISGLGYMQYQKDVRKAEINNYMTDKDSGLESFLKSNKLAIDGNINQEVYSNETGTMMPMTEQESDKFEKHWSEEVIKGLKEKMPDIMKIKNKKLTEDKERKKIKQVISGIKTQATVNTQRFISGVAKKDLTITEGDEVRELTSTESQQMIKYINEFKKSNDYKSILDSYKEANTQLKESGKQLNIDNEMQKVTVGYAKAKLKAYMAENKIKSNNK